MEELIKPEVGWKEKKRATEAARQERENQLYVRLLMAFRALRRSLFVLGIVGLVAIDADAGGGSWIVERSLRLGLHWSSSSGAVTVLAILMRGF
jgi:hypothetical protein